MSFNFTPMTDEELNSVQLVEKGNYKFEVIKSNEKISKSGNTMAELNIKFWDNHGNIHTIFDYLIFSNVPLCTRKIKHFCDSVGLKENYQIGQLPSELRGKKGYFEIGIQDEQPNPNGGFYPKKNVVLDYVVCDQESGPISNNVEPIDNDEIPF